MRKVQIVNREYYKHSSCPRNSGGSVVLYLSCGCVKRVKYSKNPRGVNAFCCDDYSCKRMDILNTAIEVNHENNS